MVAAARDRYGMSRFELGLLFLTVQEQDLWQGKAGSFWEYCDDFRLNRSAVRSYMRVARKFLVDLKLSNELVQRLCSCNMTVLERAAAMINEENALDVIEAVIALHQRDALALLDEMAPDSAPASRTDDVAKLFSRFLELPDDRRIDFVHRLNHRGSKNSGARQ